MKYTNFIVMILVFCLGFFCSANLTNNKERKTDVKHKLKKYPFSAKVYNYIGKSENGRFIFTEDCFENGIKIITYKKVSEIITYQCQNDYYSNHYRNSVYFRPNVASNRNIEYFFLDAKMKYTKQRIDIVKNLLGEPNFTDKNDLFYLVPSHVWKMLSSNADPIFLHFKIDNGIATSVTMFTLKSIN